MQNSNVSLVRADGSPRIRVNLDVDGVMCDFDGWCRTNYGGGSRELSFENPDGSILTGDEALWAYVDQHPEFWLDMPFFYGADEIMDICRPYGVRFLTGCPRDENRFARASAEKVQKLNGKFPGIEVVTCWSKHKMLHMQEPGDILVDDFIANIRRWEKAGGCAVYFKTHKQAVSDLRSALARQFPDIKAGERVWV
jgi:5'-nucleotidase